MPPPHTNPSPAISQTPVYVNASDEIRRLKLAHNHRTYAHYRFMDHDRATGLIIDEWRVSLAKKVGLTVRHTGMSSYIIDGIMFGDKPPAGVDWLFITSQPYVEVERWILSLRDLDPGYESAAVKVDLQMNVGYKAVSCIRGSKLAEWRAYPEVEVERREQLVLAITRARTGLEAMKQEPRATYEDGYPKSALSD